MMHWHARSHESVLGGERSWSGLWTKHASPRCGESSKVHTSQYTSFLALVRLCSAGCDFAQCVSSQRSRFGGRAPPAFAPFKLNR
eukprot:139776-Rhodomonas_salina.1